MTRRKTWQGRDLLDSGSDVPWHEIKARLEARGLTLSRVAEDVGLSSSAGRKVKTVPIPRVQEAIAAALDTIPQTLWPSRYLPDGRPVRPSDWIKAATRRSPGHVQNAGAI